MKWEVPYPKVLGWKMKHVSTALTDFKLLRNNVYGCYVEHDVIKNCTPEMIEWWFRNIDGDIQYNGITHTRFTLWHPSDHIHWELKREGKKQAIDIGTRFRIVEAYSANSKWMVDTVETIEKLDVTGVKFCSYLLGIRICSLEHEFVKTTGGTRYISTLKVGVDNLFGKYIINPLITRYLFNETMARAWLKHNVEEVGNFEFFLPELYMKHND